MKLKENFVLRQVAGTWIVLPLGAATVDFNGMLKLNETGALLWNTLENGGGREEMAEVLTAEYDVTRERAMVDVERFLDKLSAAGCLE